MSTIESPCAKKCCLNDEDICLGCFRTLDNILSWKKITTKDKQKILESSKSRKESHVSTNHWYAYGAAQ